MSVGLSAEHVLFARVVRGVIRLIEMLIVCLCGCLPRLYYLHVFLGCCTLNRNLLLGCLPIMYHLRVFLEGLYA